MENYFWKVLEEKIYTEIPDFIKNSLDKNGYSNALSFKNIGEAEIEIVERNMKKANQEFKFRPGDKALIKATALFVKQLVDGNGENTGLFHFANQKNGISDTCSNNEATKENNENKTKTQFFLNSLMSAAEKNAKRRKGGYRYDPKIKFYASYLFMLTGPWGYDTLQKNLECALPSLSSVKRYIQTSACAITEGILRVQELRLYLAERSLEPIVCLSEDATRINGGVQYDSKSNQIMGFVLPVNKANGMPIPFSYPARSAEEILNHFSGKNTNATFMNVIMAQPVANVPPFCLMIFGSDNKYTANDVIRRWKYIKEELNSAGISTLTISSDSDPRYNAAMRQLAELGKNSRLSWYSCSENLELPFYIQDTVHIATKLRNFLLTLNDCLKPVPFGDHFVSLKHLFELIVKFPKDYHQLTLSTLNPKDRQNFKSVLRMCDSKVISMLRNHVKDSKATVHYLQIIRDVIESFMDKNLTPLQRIRKIWYSVFLLRIWHQFIHSSEKYTLKNNFISSNCFACIELNAHGLVKLMLYLKQINKPEFFLPHLFESQPCENIFRQFRSFTSTYSTVINCTLKEAVTRISKIQYQNHIIQNTSTHFIYPRAKQPTLLQAQFILPTQEQIMKEIQFCHSLAVKTANKLGLIEKNMKERTYSCKINPYIPKFCSELKRKISQPQPSTNKSLFRLKLSDLKNIQLKNYDVKISRNEINATSPYVEVQCDDVYKHIIVKKTSLCWLLGTDYYKMSSDRLLRVRYTLNSKPKVKVRSCLYRNKQVKKKQIIN